MTLLLVVLVILFNQIHHIIFSLLLLWLSIPFLFYSAPAQNMC
jgi:hypothetical protein